MKYEDDGRWRIGDRFSFQDTDPDKGSKYTVELVSDFEAWGTFWAYNINDIKLTYEPINRNRRTSNHLKIIYRQIKTRRRQAPIVKHNRFKNL